MSDDIRAGDVVVCVDEGRITAPYFVKRGRLTYPFKRGQVLKVRAWERSETGGMGLLFVGYCAGYYDRSGSEIVFNPRRFRKLPKADEQFTEQMRALRPHRESIPC